MAANVAYLTTDKTTHVAIWTQKNKYRKASGRVWYDNEITTLCGYKKHYLVRSQLRYPSQGRELDKSVCKLCTGILDQGRALIR